ncbi:hypothetical protein Val02_15280 [Virgisporangium aliadipatigenens]|uniref:Uncharacterized protein n=1 Tax=Virgisporangium aliadipatigenens TaxID=741659 RepID=A0A8J3YHQ5_9ACTN|nr:hypothetical protein [Virgisporangium aliadipatigenens]GIJ44642.1 hypothetical protein Val02_15280 [Virgisporangium aliadipatigenens]
MLFDEHDGWRRCPAEFHACVASGPAGDVIHAASGSATLCGIPLPEVSFGRGTFEPGGDATCDACAEKAAATPPRRSVQERLYDKVLAAEPGTLRDEVLDALRRGASVHPWTMGSSADSVRPELRLHEAVEGGPEADEALRNASRVDQAEVRGDSWRFVVVMPHGARPVLVRRPLRRQAGPDRPGWSFANARKPAAFGSGTSADRVEHAVDGERTLCGIPVRDVVLYLHHFVADRRAACPRCAARAATRDQPSAQERLHKLIAAAEPGPARDDLAAALTRGAEITLWLSSRGPTLARHYAELDELTEGRAEVTEALSAGHASLAHVLHGPWRSTVVIRENGRPLIARGPTDV